MERDLTIRLDTEEIIAIERCVADRDPEEALRLLKALAGRLRHARATA